jgi:Flp pilus assembly protein TadD
MLWGATAAAAWHQQCPHENYGQSLSAAGFCEEALREFKIVQSMPEDGSVPMRDLYREIGMVYFRLNMIDESIFAWGKGLVYATYDPSLMNNLALAFLKKGQYVEAEAYAKQGLIMDAAMPTLLNTLGEVAMQNRDYGHAVDQFIKVLEINPDDSAGHGMPPLHMPERAVRKSPGGCDPIPCPGIGTSEPATGA